MPRFLVKICGVTTSEDAAMAATAGVAAEVLAGGDAMAVLEALRRIAPRPTPPS